MGSTCGRALSALMERDHMRDLNELAIRPRRRNSYPPATPAEIAVFERHFEANLPPAFVCLLQFSNGGRPTLSIFDDPNGGISGLDNFYGFGPKAADDEAAARGTWDIGNLWGETRYRRTVLGDRAIPFGSDGGDNQLFIDDTEGTAAVYRMIFATRQRYRVAASFEDFIGMLRLPPWGTKRTRANPR